MQPTKPQPPPPPLEQNPLEVEQMRRSSAVYLENISKIYKSGGHDVYAAREVTLEVRPGEFFSLLGSSGSGKTTCLRCIGGFETPEYGKVWVGGEDVTERPAYLRDVHTVFQNYALFPHLSVQDNVGFALSVKGVPKAEIVRRVGESLELVRLEGFGGRKPAQLSGGQQQRVALARALINRPKVLLLDEPLSALDAKIREEVRGELKALQRQTGITFVYVTHDQEEALAMSDRMAVMAQGKLEQVGTPLEVYHRPQTRFVAEFIGRANLLEGVLVALEGARATVEVNGIRVFALLDVGTIYRVPRLGQGVTVMLRPEKLELGAPLENRVSGKLLDSSFTGQSLNLRVLTPLGQLLVTKVGGLLEGSADLELSFRAEDALLIPIATEEK